MSIKTLAVLCFTIASAHAAMPQGCDDIPAAPPAAQIRQPAFPPVQLAIRTPQPPTAFPIEGRNLLLYELHLHTYADQPLPVKGVEIISDQGKLLASVSEAQLRSRMQQYGSGGTAVVFLCLAFDGAAVPQALRNRVLLGDGYADGPLIGTHTTQLKTLGPPLSGPGWSADNGPSLESHHRTGVFVAGGLAYNTRRYAIDWKKYQDGQPYKGDPRDAHAHLAYGAEVLAVADGMVIAARNDAPDNVPRTSAGFTPTVPMTMDNLAGNFIVIELGDGQYAQYAHLRPGSVKVRAGDRVRRGQPVAQVGISGDARVPHLHFQVSNSADFMSGEGLPYVIDAFQLNGQRRSAEYPPDGAVVGFTPRTAPN
jgi:murein DD-endopeptidase MepM/ murein hydrolase activator NlpD